MRLAEQEKDPGGHRFLDDPRNSLVFHFLRLVDELRPRAFVMDRDSSSGVSGGQVLSQLSYRP